MTRPLPPNPSVEHLKKQAKRLLKTARSGESAALDRFAAHHPSHASRRPAPERIALQEAQLVIAREFGHASWPALMTALNMPTRPAPQTEASRILLYTNGQSAVELLDAAGAPGQKLEWLEVLNDGPVPLTQTIEELYRIRAEHMASLGWTSIEGALRRFAQRDAPLQSPENYDQLQLWFEHDLYDQLQLIQVLDRVASMPAWRERTTLYPFDTFIGYLTPETLRQRLPAARPISSSQLRLAQRAWAVFRSSDPDVLPRFLDTDTRALPFLSDAFLRLLEERPDPANGLGRTERQILEALAAEAKDPPSLFKANQQRETAAFMGDATFFAIVQRLSRGKRPLLATETAAPFRTPAEAGYTQEFRAQRLRLTQNGKRVLAGDSNWLDHLSEPYWIGGCSVTPNEG